MSFGNETFCICLFLGSLYFPTPGFGPDSWSRPQALGPYFHLPTLAPNLYLPALVSDLYLLALALNNNFYLPVEVKILLLPQLLLILFTTSTITIAAASTTTTTATTTAATTNYNNNNKKCICGSNTRIKWSLKDI